MAIVTERHGDGLLSRIVGVPSREGAEPIALPERRELAILAG